MLVSIEKSILLLTFCQCYWFVMVMKKHGGGTPRSTSRTNLVPVYVRNKASTSTKRIECTRARINGKSPDVRFGILFQDRMLVLCQEGGGYLRLRRDVVLIFAVCRKLDGKIKELLIGNGFDFLWSGSSKAENRVEWQLLTG